MDSSTLDTQFRTYLMEERRILRDKLASIEKQLNLHSKERQLQERVRELEDRLASAPRD